MKRSGTTILALAALLQTSVAEPAASETSNSSGPTLTLPRTYVGDDACIKCHQEKVSTYHRSAHFNTSAFPAQNTIHGSFSAGSNILNTMDPALHFEMLTTNGAFFQKAVRQVSATRIGHRDEQFGLVIGSGRKGQTYGYWRGDLLYQLPVSFWTEMGWVNSPGFTDGIAYFERPISPRCLECHANSFESVPPTINRYKFSSLVPGITCEKCHGPASEHVARYQSSTPPRSRSESALINLAGLDRERKIDACELCHAPRASLPGVPPLSFVPGAALDKYLAPVQSNPEGRVDVHGGQVQLLRSSRCFQSGPTMTCTTCHDVHVTQRDPAIFAPRCLTCHKVENCGVFKKLGHRIDKECVVCHMPEQPTSLIISSANGKKLQAKMHNHRIAIYPEVQLPSDGR